MAPAAYVSNTILQLPYHIDSPVPPTIPFWMTMPVMA
eukprot:CAMPEP_0117567904 /NCGR_PEP_ID=MMETSP0784-20121206/57853_1 /TAXON_ID=39447 /ORGANISM="" /LENGTH=36 /DNA_ID= /DNA_START= /DNA_END= /DNA_ORIENTATION=